MSFVKTVCSLEDGNTGGSARVSPGISLRSIFLWTFW